MELWKSKIYGFYCLFVVMLLLILSFHFPIVYWFWSLVCELFFFCFARFYNEIFKYYIVKHIKILIFFLLNYFMKIKF